MGGIFTWAVFQEAVGRLLPVSAALGATVGRAVALPGSLHGSVGAGRGTGAPPGPLVPGSVH